jgi:cation diffusion facilitator family transporter
MLVGVRKSREPPDEEHQFGHGRELYFWSLVVAFSVFAVGGGLSFYEGVLHVLHPEPITDAAWNYGVLGASFIFEGVSWYFGWRAFDNVRRGRPVIEAMRVSKDPTTFAVLLEDSAALTGLVIAFMGVFLGQQLEVPYFDGIASILIGVLLCLVALFLGRESKSLLIGEAVSRETFDDIRRIAEAESGVEKVLKILTIYIGPDEVAATLELKFRPEVSATELRRAARQIETNIREKYPRIKHVFYKAESLTEHESSALKRGS